MKRPLYYTSAVRASILLIGKFSQLLNYLVSILETINFTRGGGGGGETELQIDFAWTLSVLKENIYPQHSPNVWSRYPPKPSPEGTIFSRFFLSHTKLGIVSSRCKTIT